MKYYKITDFVFVLNTCWRPDVNFPFCGVNYVPISEIHRCFKQPDTNPASIITTTLETLQIEIKKHNMIIMRPLKKKKR